jgi:hypothetical protein
MIAPDPQRGEGIVGARASGVVSCWLRWGSAVAWIGWTLTNGLLWWQYRMRVLHPFVHTFLFLFVLTIGSVLAVVALGTCQLWRGPHRGAALEWILVGLLPVLIWLASTVYGLRQFTQGRRVTPRVIFQLMEMAGASLMELQAVDGYSHRQRTGCLVMF